MAAQAPVPLRWQATAADAAYRAEGGSSGAFRALGASAAGAGHRLAGRRCDDSFAWALPSPGCLVVAVADGVSGAQRGGEGADLAVRAVCDYVLGPGAEVPHVPDGGGAAGIAAVAVARAGDALTRAAAALGRPPAELSTTLVVAVTWVSAGRAYVELARVGDSTAFVLAPDGWRELFEGTDDDLGANVTAVLPYGPGPLASPVETSSAELAGPDALVLLTDGVANPLRDGPNSVAPALAEVVARGAVGELSPLALAAAADFSRRGCQDDRTIVAVWAWPGS